MSEAFAPTTRDRGVWVIWLLTGLAAGALAMAVANMPHKPTFVDKPVASASLLLSDAGGHGSGIHIGDGYVLTAAHVPGTDTSMDVKTSIGTTQKAVVLWVNNDYDVALLRLDSADGIDSAPLDCAPNYAGQKVKLLGNPEDLEFVWTEGVVVGDARTVPPTKGTLVPVNGAMVFGQSGGGVLDEGGNVVGINDATLIAAVPVAYGMVSASLTGIGYIIPASTVCMLLARPTAAAEGAR